MKKLYVGNLPYGTSETDLETLFGQFGKVESAVIITDRMSGRSKGFGFVTFDSADNAKEALRLNGTALDGRNITVSEAREKTGGGGGDRGDRGGRGDGRRARSHDD